MLDPSGSISATLITTRLKVISREYKVNFSNYFQEISKATYLVPENMLALENMLGEGLNLPAEKPVVGVQGLLRTRKKRSVGARYR